MVHHSKQFVTWTYFGLKMWYTTLKYGTSMKFLVNFGPKFEENFSAFVRINDVLICLYIVAFNCFAFQ